MIVGALRSIPKRVIIVTVFLELEVNSLTVMVVKERLTVTDLVVFYI